MFVRRKLGDDNLIAANDYLSFNVKHFDNSRKILCWKREGERQRKRNGERVERGKEIEIS